MKGVPEDKLISDRYFTFELVSIVVLVYDLRDVDFRRLLLDLLIHPRNEFLGVSGTTS